MPTRRPKLADIVAASLRDRILTGQLLDGEELPRQEDMLAEFGVSKPSLREALRILEAEGLTTVRRGNVGGAIVHAPNAKNAAFMIGLTLQFRQVQLADVGTALQGIEPVCASLCAVRADRSDAVLPALRKVHQEAISAVDEPVEFTRVTRLFHETIVATCGNETLILVVGALESLWSSSERRWASSAEQSGRFPGRSQRLKGLRVHDRLIARIEAGDVDGVLRYAGAHLRDSLEHMIYDTTGSIVAPVI
jgi:GntR family transcriptional repressor for pyruvate dehydrogenase complex